MKLLTNTYQNKINTFLCIETLEDAQFYIPLNAKIKSRQAVGFWIGFKSQDFRRTPLDYVAHEVEYNPIARVLAVKMSLSEKDTSLVDYCNDADNLIIDMNKTIIKYVSAGKMVRINLNGGYCPIYDLDEYETIRDINHEQTYNYLLYMDTDYKFEITGKSVLIENDRYIPKKLIEKFCKTTVIEDKDVQVINSFKHKTILHNEEGIIKFFKDGIKNGMENIFFQTTGQDIPQINKLKAVLEYVMAKYPDRTLNIYAELSEYHHKLLTTKSTNIKINFL